ncbi:monovalent cation/H+ antiporter complex subunit F [Truepera radiovictrix]|uniref:Multisubunit sodium/proton antiporter, MrpF subunit (2.A.63.1) n=1 Tax=Truepera radiovictrix (strain DSM 17093 / CIP 108686 / LMG 22925 / RQ-24) TaxID=649638 RepID=D7CYF8_TRURR|nr:monovalent cation/H+ antiporter complex subunit F [Truepera radiovictrix]ADI14797.1 multisubunit sodium/proton antiporter, MrpF subunit (2.A.63.1) [Truepera radiovictrix DSM 17093]WMT56652.1 monovalent cation/H+ antiporter complex subunit F [Truepera radiovictrix]
MTELYLAATLFLLANIFAGLVRVLRGPTPADRMMASQLFGTTGVAMLLLLAEGLASPALRDVALLFALLGALALVAFVRRAWIHKAPSDGPERSTP